MGPLRYLHRGIDVFDRIGVFFKFRPPGVVTETPLSAKDTVNRFVQYNFYGISSGGRFPYG